MENVPFGHSTAFGTHLTPGDGCHGDAVLASSTTGRQEEGRASSHGETCEDKHTISSALPGHTGAVQPFTNWTSEEQSRGSVAAPVASSGAISDQAARASSNTAGGQKVQECEQEAEAAGKKERLSWSAKRSWVIRGAEQLDADSSSSSRHKTSLSWLSAECVCVLVCVRAFACVCCPWLSQTQLLV